MVILVSLCFLAAAYASQTFPVEDGLQIFRTKCARCHNVNAQGYNAPDLTQPWKRNLNDSQLAALITRGNAPSMPATNLDQMQMARLIAYLRSLRGPARVDTGDAKRGEVLFWGKAECSKCHMVRGRGGRIGPDLTQVGAIRSKAFITRELRSPNDYIPRGYDPVIVVTNTGERVKGIRKNEDAFSIQMMDEHENLRMFLKPDLREISALDESLMPRYGPEKLSESEFNDLLRYLSGLQ